MSGGITTTISRSSMPEKVADVMERASDNKQQATLAVAQNEAEKRANTIQKTSKTEVISPVKRDKGEKRKKEENNSKGKDKRRKDTNGIVGSNFDMDA